MKNELNAYRQKDKEYKQTSDRYKKLQEQYRGLSTLYRTQEKKCQTLLQEKKELNGKIVLLTQINDTNDEPPPKIPTIGGRSKPQKSSYSSGYDAGFSTGKSGDLLPPHYYQEYVDGDDYARGFIDGWNAGLQDRANDY